MSKRKDRYLCGYNPGTVVFNSELFKSLKRLTLEEAKQLKQKLSYDNSVAIYELVPIEEKKKCSTITKKAISTVLLKRWMKINKDSKPDRYIKNECDRDAAAIMEHISGENK